MTGGGCRGEGKYSHRLAETDLESVFYGNFHEGGTLFAEQGQL